MTKLGILFDISNSKATLQSINPLNTNALSIVIQLSYFINQLKKRVIYDTYQIP